MKKKAVSKRNPIAEALLRRAANAAVAVVADTRHRVQRPKAGAGSYKRRQRGGDELRLAACA